MLRQVSSPGVYRPAQSPRAQRVLDLSRFWAEPWFVLEGDGPFRSPEARDGIPDRATLLRAPRTYAPSGMAGAHIARNWFTRHDRILLSGDQQRRQLPSRSTVWSVHADHVGASFFE